MFKAARSCEDHSNAKFIASINDFLITDGPECVYVLALPSTPQTKNPATAGLIIVMGQNILPFPNYCLRLQNRGH